MGKAITESAVRLELRARAYNLNDFPRRLALPKAVVHWSVTTLHDKLIKIGAKVVCQGCYSTLQMADDAILRAQFAKILRLIDGLRRAPLPA